MTKPFRGGKSLWVFALLTVLVAALSSFGQPVHKVDIPQNPGFQFGVQESDSQMFNYDVTGATTVNPYATKQNALTDVNVRGREVAHLGSSTSGMVQTGFNLRPLFGPYQLHRFTMGRPEKNVFQAGPFFLQFHDITAGLLISDNVNFVPNNAEWGAIAELRLRLSAILQLAPTWRLVVSGSVIYLPFDNEFGIEGFGIGDALGLIAEGTVEPLTRIQLAYNSRWADWEVQIVDDFRARYISASGEFQGAGQGFIQPEGVHAEDRAGRYVFGNGTTIPQQNLVSRQNDFLDYQTFIQLENLVGGSATRMLPTETRLTFGANHSDFWYKGNWDNGTNNATNGLGFSATSADRVFAALRNERESMRFKPYAFYDAYRYNYQPNWSHQAGAGFAGPISDYLFFGAEGGYFWSDAALTDTWFYRFRLVHELGPYTRQLWEYSRNVTEPVNEIRDTYRYLLNQVLGPQMYARLHIQRSVYTPNQLGVYGSVEDSAYVRVVWNPAPRHTYIIGGSYANNRFDNPTEDRQTTWEARAEIRYRWTPSVTFSFLYRYLNIDTRQALQEFDRAENLWVFTARKLF